MAAISSNGKAKMSCSTKESRSAGASLENHEQREADRVGELRFALGVASLSRARSRFGRLHVQGILAPQGARAQHVQADPADDRRQPSAEVLDAARLGAAEAQPGFLDRVVRFAQRAEAAWRDAPYFTDAERAALALTEAVTRLSDREDPVPDEIWNEAARHYDESTLATLLLSIALINVRNRLNVATRQVAGEWAKSPEAREWVERSVAAR